MALQDQVQKNGQTMSNGTFLALLILSGTILFSLGFFLFYLVYRCRYRNRLDIFINYLCHTVTLGLVLAGFLFALKSNQYPEEHFMRTDTSNSKKPTTKTVSTDENVSSSKPSQSTAEAQEKESPKKLGARNRRKSNNDMYKDENISKGDSTEVNNENGINKDSKYHGIHFLTTAVPASLGFIVLLAVL